MEREVAPGVRLVRAGNASPLTADGTNTWLVGDPSGRGPVAVIDPGPADPGHLAAILAAAGEVSHILVTHPHLDHSGLAQALKAATGAPVLAFGTATDGRSALMQALAGQGIQGGEGLDAAFVPDFRLADGAVVRGAGWELTALHTPGHSAPHLAFLAGEGLQASSSSSSDGDGDGAQHGGTRGQGGRLLFSGDLAMGWASTLISPPDGDMADYMASLERLGRLGRLRLLPGHGDPVPDGQARLSFLHRHRLERRAAILAALEAGPARLAELTRAVYTDTPARLLPAAGRNVLAHLLELAGKSEIVTEGEGIATSTFRLR